MTKPLLTPDEFVTQMKAIKEDQGGDTEICHATMDELMCDLLVSLGYGEGVLIFSETERWYA